ncbi:MAG: helix-turn-helix domain-containing protein [Lachnospiraceae bacterium]
MSLSGTLKELISAKNISLSDVADLSGVPYETVRNIYYGKVTDPKISTVVQISKALDVSVDYLLGEQNSVEMDILRLYHMCGTHGKSLIHLVAKYEATAAKEERNSIDKHRIPCLVPIGNEEDGILYNSCEIIEINTSKKEAYVGIEITTNNFAPSYCKDDIILLENRFPSNGEWGVFYKEEKAYLRKYIEESGQYRLECVHNRGQDFVLKRMNEMECVGTCIGVVRE